MENTEVVTPPVQLNPSTHDVHSYSEPEKIRVRHIDLDLEPSFDRRTLEGSVVLTIEKAPGHLTAPLVLDTRSLSIHAVDASADGKSFRNATYEVGSEDPIFGAPLTITLLPQEFKVRINYSTASNATALQCSIPPRLRERSFLSSTLSRSPSTPGVGFLSKTLPEFV